MSQRIVLALILLLAAAGCATPKAPVYYYGNYARTLYQSKKNVTPERLAKHKEELSDVIEKSKKRDLRVPPGIYCEYGWLLAHEGNSTEAERFFALEEQTYPESSTFVAFLRNQLKKS